MILIYNDEGTSQDSINALLNILPNAQTVSGNDLQHKHTFTNATTLIIPGGRSLPFYKKLGITGNKNIIQFVEEGGCYIGLCAGAYYAARHTIFAENHPLELKLPGELNFFEGRAIGPVFAQTEFAYQSENGARMVNITWHDGTHDSIYFNGGCYFENANDFKNTAVLAVYADNKKPAIIQCAIGKGRAILSGVHPELSNQPDLFLKLN